MLINLTNFFQYILDQQAIQLVDNGYREVGTHMICAHRCLYTSFNSDKQYREFTLTENARPYKYLNKLELLLIVTDTQSDE